MGSEYSDREEKSDICTGSPEKTYVNSYKGEKEGRQCFTWNCPLHPGCSPPSGNGTPHCYASPWLYSDLGEPTSDWSTLTVHLSHRVHEVEAAALHDGAPARSTVFFSSTSTTTFCGPAEPFTYSTCLSCSQALLCFLILHGLCMSALL